MPKPTEETSEAEIERMRDEFNKELDSYYKDQQITTQWDAKRIEDVIEKIESGIAYYYISKYKIKTLNGKKVLTHKKHDNPKNIIRIVPSEEYFDILFDTHIKSGHGGRDKLKHHLKDSVYIPSTIVALFPKHCKICKSKGYIKKGARRDACDYKRGYIHLIDMTKTPYGSHNYIMYYQDLTTSLSFLRALTKISHYEIAMELTKIFLEYGGPAVLSTTRSETFTKNIIDTLKNMHPDLILLVGKKIDREEQDDCENRVRSNMITWLSGNKSKNWSLAIHFVQFNLNSSFDEDLDGTPFQAVIGSIPKMGVDTTDIPEELAKSWNDENDLINWQSDPKTKRARKTQKASKKSSRNEEKTCNEGNASDSEERVWCWVCEKDDDAVTFLCNSCNGAIHQTCGNYRDGDDDVIICHLCLNEKDGLFNQIVQLEVEDKNMCPIKIEDPFNTI